VRGVTLDTGALIGLDRGDTRVTALLQRIATEPAAVVSIPAGVVGQAWRGGQRQTRLASLLSAPETSVVPLDHQTARAVGVLLGRAGARDVVDASVVICARERRQAVITSDPADLKYLDPHLPVRAV